MGRNVTIIMIGLLMSATGLARAKIPVITVSSELARHVGQVVTLRGMVENSRIATLLGVDIESENPDLRGRMAQATGRLLRWTVTPADLKQQQKDGMIANRGPGTFYKLVDAAGHLVQVEAAPK